MTDETQRTDAANLADRAAKKAVEEMLTLIGVDVSDPIKTQEQFQNLRRLGELLDDSEMIADAMFVRNVRQAVSTIKVAGLRAATRILVTVVFSVLALGTAAWFKQRLGSWWPF